MRGVRVGGVYGLLLSAQEVKDIRECVESYCIGVTGPSMPISPDVAEYYPEGTRVHSPVHERFWRLHAEMANRTSRRKAKVESGSNGG